MRFTRRSLNVVLALFVTLACAPIARSQSGYDGPPSKADVEYGVVDGQKLLLDVYLPPAATEQRATKRSAVVLIHGGGWTGGDKQSPPQVMLGNALSQSGYVCFSLNYRLAKGKQNLYPAQIDDVQRAVRWIRSRGREYRIDATNLAAIGDLAGGHLVSLLGTTDTRSNDDPTLARYSSRVQFVIDICGPSDIAIRPDNPVDRIRANVVKELMGKMYDDDPEAFKAASPIYHVDSRSAAFLILHGTADPLVPIDQSEKFCAALQKAGVEATLVKFQGEGHGFRKPENRLRVFDLTKEFLARHLPVVVSR